LPKPGGWPNGISPWDQESRLYLPSELQNGQIKE